MEVSKYIKELLQEHNCVIVPEFGGFIANYQPAHIDRVNNRIDPPSKHILFNGHLLKNDGLLGHAIAHGENVAYPTALTQLKETSTQWLERLKNGERIELGDLGFLFWEADRVAFEQNRETNLLLNAYGLSGIRFVTATAEETKTEVATKVKEVAAIAETPIQEIKPKTGEVSNTPVIELNKEEEVISAAESEESETVILDIRKGKANRWKYVGIAAAVPVMFYMYWIPMETDFMATGKIQVSDFNPVRNNPQRVYMPRQSEFQMDDPEKHKSWEELTEHLSDNVTVYNYQLADDTYIPIRLERPEKVLSNTAKEVKEETANDDKVVSSQPYHIIGGCFSVKENANQLVQQLASSGFNAQILDHHKGLYRVTAGDYQKRSEARQALASFKNQGHSGWILKK